MKTIWNQNVYRQLLTWVHLHLFQSIGSHIQQNSTFDHPKIAVWIVWWKKNSDQKLRISVFWVEISYAYVTATKAATKTNKIVVFIFNTDVCSLLKLDNLINEHETTAYWLFIFCLISFLSTLLSPFEYIN